MIDLKNHNIILTGATGVLGGSILAKLNQANANIIATGTNPVSYTHLTLPTILRV